MRRVAAIVNASAHRVSPAVIAALRAGLGDDVFVTRSAADARAAMATVVARGVELVCVAGGDGTFVQAVGDVHDLAHARPPILFALRCGLGNAIADVSGASSASPAGIARDLERARGDEAPVPLAVVRANGRIACYAGVGLDAMFVEDLYAVAKGRWKRAAATLRGATGLVATVVGRTLPRLLTYQPPRVTVVARAPATPLDRRGRPGGADAPAGTILHDGPALVAAAGTIASYGRGFTAFPFADAVGPTRFHLRVWSIGAATLLRHLPGVWRGSYVPEPGVRDWATTAVELRWARPHVIHIGGDLVAPTTRLAIDLVPWTVPFLRGRLASTGSGS